MKQLSLILLLALCAMPAQAQETKQRYKGNLGDFEKVQILCLTDRGGDYLMAALCAATESEVRTSARRADIDVKPGYSIDKGDMFTVYVNITSAGTTPRAVAVRVEASREYLAAIDTEADGRSPAGSARKGRLVMFEDTITSYGMGDTMERQLRAGLKQTIRRLFDQIKQEK
jgi:hypothetical protein